MLSSKPLKHRCVSSGTHCQQAIYIQMPGAILLLHTFRIAETLPNQCACLCSFSNPRSRYHLFRQIEYCACLLEIYVAPQPFMSFLIWILYKSFYLCFCTSCSIRLASLFLVTSALIFCHKSLYVPSILSASK